jgi:hypothetical protein
MELPSREPITPTDIMTRSSTRNTIRFITPQFTTQPIVTMAVMVVTIGVIPAIARMTTMVGEEATEEGKTILNVKVERSDEYEVSQPPLYLEHFIRD